MAPNLPRQPNGLPAVRGWTVKASRVEGCYIVACLKCRGSVVLTEFGLGCRRVQVLLAMHRAEHGIDDEK
jgi:hypothetical protein